MKDIKRHSPGTFSWVELGTSDTAAAKKFYQSLFGWTAMDIPMGPDFTYTILQLEGQDVGGLYKLMPDQVSQGVPPNWLSYVEVNNADDAARNIKELGGKVIVEPMDVPNSGRFAVIDDPQGAKFGIWQSGKSTGVKMRDEVGSLVWNELGTTDEKAGEKFYTTLFGWQTELMPGGPMKYTLFKQDSKSFAGMFQLTPEMKGLPPHWIPYFAVADADDAISRTKAGGGKVMNGPIDIPDVGRFAILQDPQGAMLAVIKTAPM